MNRAAKGRWSDCGSRSWTPVEVDSSDPLRGEECPGVMAWRICVVERNAVEVDVVIAIRKPAEARCALAETHTIGIGCKASQHHLRNFTVIRQRRSEIMNVSLVDLSTGRGCAQQSIHGRMLRSKRIRCIGLDRHLLRHAANRHGQRDILRLSNRKLKAASYRGSKT